MLIAQISDLHIQEGGKDTELIQAERHLSGCVKTLNRLAPRPDLVGINSDLTEHGRKQEYLLLKPWLSELDIAYLLIPGNHDSPAMLREVFHEHAYLQTSSPFIQYAIDGWPLRIVALDTTVPMRSEGNLCAERLQWLSGNLAQAPGKPTVVPMQSGITSWGERGWPDG